MVNWFAPLYLIYASLGLLLTIFLAAALARRPSARLAFFLAFFIVCVLDSAGAFVSQIFIRGVGLPFSYQNLWMAGLSLSRLKFAFLALYAHSFHPYRFTPLLSAAAIALACAAAALSLIVYTPIPKIIEAVLSLYPAAYLASLLPRRGQPKALTDDPGTTRAILYCTAVFLIGILIDLMEALPLTGPFVSVLILDFDAAFAICLASIVSFRSLSKRAPSGSDAFAALSEREREVALLVAEGESNKDIAAKLFISESTVKKHVNRIFKKLKAGNRWALIKMAGQKP